MYCISKRNEFFSNREKWRAIKRAVGKDNNQLSNGSGDDGSGKAARTTAAVAASAVVTAVMTVVMVVMTAAMVAGTLMAETF